MLNPYSFTCSLLLPVVSCRWRSQYPEPVWHSSAPGSLEYVWSFHVWLSALRPAALWFVLFASSTASSPQCSTSLIWSSTLSRCNDARELTQLQSVTVQAVYIHLQIWDSTESYQCIDCGCSCLPRCSTADTNSCSNDRCRVLSYLWFSWGYLILQSRYLPFQISYCTFIIFQVSVTLVSLWWDQVKLWRKTQVYAQLWIYLMHK